MNKLQQLYDNTGCPEITELFRDSFGKYIVNQCIAVIAKQLPEIDLDKGQFSAIMHQTLSISINKISDHFDADNIHSNNALAKLVSSTTKEKFGKAIVDECVDMLNFEAKVVASQTGMNSSSISFAYMRVAALIEGHFKNGINAAPVLAEAQQPNSATYSRHWEQQVYRFDSLQVLARKIDEFANDSSKNVKMGFVLRTVDYTSQPPKFLENSEIIGEPGVLLKGDNLLQFTTGYAQHINEKYGEDVTTEIIVHYYPMDINKKIENVHDNVKVEQVKYVPKTLPINLSPKYR